MTTPVACSLRVAASPLKGALPVARQSRFHGGMRPTPVACSLRVAASPLKGALPVARQSRFHGSLPLKTISIFPRSSHV